MTVNEIVREQYLIKRRRRKIKHIDVASYVGCSQSLISRFEIGECGMSSDKVKRYMDYIDNHEKESK